MKSTEFKRHRIEQTNNDLVLVKGFPSREQLTDWLCNTAATVYCLFPSQFQSEQAQLQLRTHVRNEVEKLNVASVRCVALTIADDSVGTSLEQFDFEAACDYVIEMLTPIQPQSSQPMTIPSFE
ncbi:MULTISPECIES: hypothetical protein [Pseudoalteromonas]|uniref:Uncharacterized protein n=1 Tax=Pseudoalteromonas peptidolytica F12-50-A1 TaxID=1315280 RepID=A0A8I0MXR5_9GAMM|nr:MULTISPECIES: hypothetical protein [Pseudoalteromonas]MBE0347919.1 hypothetical protein [Pseudoalteromonas peptidolytica F12-50-A1]NLR15285.1 hypothetical protein [Pseudoalteromonas peptidolytica]RRS09152.1 hypothetical protein EAG18_08510 [Pseudoalteromonas sp. J010]RXF01026.1 hypothetical protein D9603_14085 [Pseudoalteromonas sp. PS5]USD31148.1 hypothetical protein J8Z24_21270 [Pseudoalteromonas sp. SCSIO 43201]